MTLHLPSPLVEVDWLAAHLEHPDLCVFDCTTFLHPEGDDYRVESGRAAWLSGHIPGSAFADLAEDLSAPGAALRFTLPSPEQFAAAMSRLGVDERACVALYDSDMNVWAARMWWMLRAFGFDNAAVLNGGLRAWQRAGLALASGEPTSRRQPGRFTPSPRPALIADTAEVASALDDASVCLINALSAENFQALRLPGSVHVGARSLVDPESHRFLPLPELRSRFEEVGALSAARVVTYCGAGIVASSDALILTMLGASDVAVYDGSLSEWVLDPERPVEKG